MYLKIPKKNDIIINAVEAHHGDVEPKTIEAVLIQAADAISASRPGGKKRNFRNIYQETRKLESIADSFEGVEKSYAIQAGREIRLVVKPEKVIRQSNGNNGKRSCTKSRKRNGISRTNKSKCNKRNKSSRLCKIR